MKLLQPILLTVVLSGSYKLIASEINQNSHQSTECVQSNIHNDILFGAKLHHEIIVNKCKAITQVLERVDCTDNPIIEHAIAQLSLEKAQELRQYYYELHGMVDPSHHTCSDIKKHRSLHSRLATAVITLFTLDSALFYMVQEGLVQRGPAHYFFTGPERERARRITGAVYGCFTLLGLTLALAGVDLYLVLSGKWQSFDIDFCEYRERLLEALDKRINKLSELPHHKMLISQS